MRWIKFIVGASLAVGVVAAVVMRADIRSWSDLAMVFFVSILGTSATIAILAWLVSNFRLDRGVDFGNDSDGGGSGDWD
jgi:hypothetical protein